MPEGSVGKRSHEGVVIMDDEGNVLPVGVRGEICVERAHAFSGYENNPDANAAAFRNGYFRTGDEGYLDHDPLMKLINLKWYLRGITNAIIDSAIHVDGMTREAAMTLMIEGGFQEEREAAGKWVRAQLSSAQLSTYFVGYQEHLEMRADVEAAWGDEFTLRRYHDQALSYGSPPVKYVRALMLNQPIPRRE